MKNSIFLISGLLIHGMANSQDMITKMSGEEINAKVTEVNDKEIVYRKTNDPSGQASQMKKSEIFMIKYANGTKDIFDHASEPSALAAPSDPIKKGATPIDISGDPKTAAIPEGMSILYIVRPAFIGTLVKFKVDCDGKPIGITKGKEYLYCVLDPGQHELSSKAENTSILKIFTEPNKKYFIEQKVKMGAMYARNQLELLDETSGTIKLGKCSLASETK
jgi:hypothetical protein